MAHLPPPLFNVVPLATMFVGNRKRPKNVKGGGGGGSGYLKTPLFRKMSKQFYRRLQVNTAYPKWTRRHTLPSRRINFKDKKSLIFDFVLSLSLSQLRAIARRHVSYRQKHQYRFFFHWGFHEDRFWVHYFFWIYINDLPLSLQNSETDTYADDTTMRLYHLVKR